MEPLLRNIRDSDSVDVVSIVNYFTINSFAAFADEEVDIEGLEYTVEIWQEPAEALATIGMKMPD